MRNILPRILALAGFTAVSTGLWMWSHIAALIIGGLIVCVASIVLMARNLLARHYTAVLEKQQALNVQDFMIHSSIHEDSDILAKRVTEAISNGARLSKAN